MNLSIIKDIAERSLKFDNRPSDLKELIRRPESFKYYNFLSMLAKEFNPELIIELGTNQGVSALHFRFGNPNSRIISIDIKQPEKVQKELLRNQIGCIEMDSVKAAEKIGAPIGILFIDSLHTYEHVKNEYFAFLPKMAKPGIILLDDIFLDDQMRQAWDLIVHYDKIAIPELHPTTGFGIVLIK